MFSLSLVLLSVLNKVLCKSLVNFENELMLKWFWLDWGQTESKETLIQPNKTKPCSQILKPVHKALRVKQPLVDKMVLKLWPAF